MKTLMLICICFFLGCSKNGLFKDDELSLERQKYEGSQLRVDGYYFLRYSVNGNHRNIIYFLYRDGTLLYGDTPLDSEINEIEEEFKSGEFYNYAENRKAHWGLFEIDGNSIKFERWYQSSPYKAYVREGEVLNDTTFKITQSYRMKDGEKTERKERDETFNFKEFSPKPDSTNKFVD